MKSKLFILIAALFCISFTTQAGNNDSERLNDRQLADMTRALSLTDAQVDEFAKTYYQFLAEFKAVNQSYPSLKAEGGVELTDEQIKTNIETRFKAARAILDVREKYYKKYLKFLSPQQIEKLYKLEKKHSSRHAMKGHGKPRPDDKGRPNTKKPRGKCDKPGKGKKHNCD